MTEKGIFLFPRATSQAAMLAWIFGDCARIKYHVVCSGVFDLRKKYERKTWRRPEKNVK